MQQVISYLYTHNAAFVYIMMTRFIVIYIPKDLIATITHYKHTNTT